MNNIHDRGMIKWQPFDSLTNSKKLCYDLLATKNKVSMPTLSDDQIQVLEDKVKESYYNKELILIDYYYNGDIKQKITKIKYININKKQLICSDTSIIYFKQLLKIKCL